MNVQRRPLTGAILVLVGLIAIASLGRTAVADMQIRLKDGRVLTVPVDEAEIGSITFGEAADGRPLAKRAADRIREDAEQVRFATEAAEKAASAAARAEEAARTAARAAEEARAARNEARAAAEAAKRVAHQPPEPADIPHPARPPAAREAADAPAEAPGVAPDAPAEPPGVRLPGIARPNLPDAAPRATAEARVLSVGEGGDYALPSLAARAARDGDIIEIAAGAYRGDVAVWSANNLLIRGVGGRVLLDAEGEAAERKATWVVKGRNTTIENIAFTGSSVPHMNGAGIRLEGAGLVLRGCEFYGNQMGILTGRNPESDILIERSRFHRNTVDYPRHRRLGHNIYIGHVRSFTLRFSHVSGAEYGHNVKTRASRNMIAYNMIADGADGFASYQIDLPDGGLSFVIGNVIHQSTRTHNPAMLSYGAEDPEATEALYVVNNTFINERPHSIFVHRRTPGTTHVGNNILAGGGTALVGDGVLQGNLMVEAAGRGSPGPVRPATGALAGNLTAPSAGFENPERMDFRITRGSPAINAAVRPPVVDGEDLTPLFHYVPHADATQRPVGQRLDIGAYEYGSE